MKKQSKSTSTRSLPAGRNRYPKKCCFCGTLVPAFQGFLKKNTYNKNYDVFHEACKPGAVTTTTPSNEVQDEDNILSILEAKLINRQLQGEPVVMLPKIIDYIKSLQLKIVELSK